MHADAANIPGINEMQLACEVSDISFLIGSDATSSSEASTTCSETRSDTGCEPEADMGGNMAEPGKQIVAGSGANRGAESSKAAISSSRSNTAAGDAAQPEHGQVPTAAAASVKGTKPAYEPNKRRRIEICSSTTSEDAQDTLPCIEQIEAQSESFQGGVTSATASHTAMPGLPEPQGVQYVYPGYLREGVGRELLTLSLDMRAPTPDDRPAWSVILHRLRALA